MSYQSGEKKSLYREVIFQVILHVVVFIFYSFDKNEPQIRGDQLAFFGSYALAALVINYLLLPRFFYQKKYLLFVGGVIMLVALAIVNEEMILERIFFPDTRGQFFPGVFTSILDVLPPIIILSAFKFAWDALNKQHEVEKLQNAVQESELQFLKSQVNPHFLFNNLNNLYAYALEDSPKTPAIILELSSVLRYMLYECQAKYVPLQKEVKHLENFTKLHQLQIEDRGVVRFETEGIRGNFQIAPLILIVFIENAFKHSQSSMSREILIDISLMLDQHGKLLFKCRNNYQAQSNTENLSQGIGLTNVKKRLAILYPQAHSLEINDSEGIYEVNLWIQLHGLRITPAAMVQSKVLPSTVTE